MTMFKKVLLLGIGVYMVAALSLAQAQDSGPDSSASKMRPGQRIQEIFKQLNLTDDQKSQLEANKKQHRAIMEKSREDIKAAKDALKEELMKAQLDMPKINELQAEVKALLSQEEDSKLSSILAVRTILTPEQFTKFVTLMDRHKPEHPE
jgi:Spy/CpxP family protein refolding chaperone